MGGPRHSHNPARRPSRCLAPLRFPASIMFTFRLCRGAAQEDVYGLLFRRRAEGGIYRRGRGRFMQMRRVGVFRPVSPGFNRPRIPGTSRCKINERHIRSGNVFRFVRSEGAELDRRKLRSRNRIMQRRGIQLESCDEGRKGPFASLGKSNVVEKKTPHNYSL